MLDTHLEIATEGIISDTLKNVFSFGNIDNNSRVESVGRFIDIIEAPWNLFGKNPETAPYALQLSYVKVDEKLGFISITNISFKTLFARIAETYGEKKLNAIFYRTYTAKSIRKFNRKKIPRAHMEITSLLSPTFFALELCILFNQLYSKYKYSIYRKIAVDIYKQTWVGRADKVTWKSPDINYANAMLNNGYALKPHQIDFIKAYPERKAKLNLRGIYLAFDQGLGKTLTSLSLAMALHIDKIYVVCPNTLVANWYSEILSYYGDRLVPHICSKKNAPNNARVFITNNESIKNMLAHCRRWAQLQKY